MATISSLPFLSSTSNPQFTLLHRHHARKPFCIKSMSTQILTQDDHRHLHNYTSSSQLTRWVVEKKKIREEDNSRRFPGEQDILSSSQAVNRKDGAERRGAVAMERRRPRRQWSRGGGRGGGGGG
ncbi:hypothetical protein Drorol1_Dr00027381 [Drosera rotundifolia]